VDNLLATPVACPYNHQPTFKVLRGEIIPMTMNFEVRYERAESATKLSINPERVIILGQLVAIAVTIPAAIIAGLFLP
jgi:hypothetical protein